MVPACIANSDGNACLAFARDVPNGLSPLHNVLILRIIIAPLWGTVLPLMAAAGTRWQTFLEEVSEERVGIWQLLRYLRNPVIRWLWMVGMASGLAVGVWFGGELGALSGAAVG